ncbi:MAG: DUF998 domain-containing protein [Stackebrandtia sp.]
MTATLPRPDKQTRGSDTVSAAAAPMSAATRVLLAAGAIATPLFMITVVIQQLTRDGVNARTQPLSLLSLGELGWIQITNFVLCGLLAFASAFGIRRTLRGGPAGTWGPILIGWYGLALVYGGVFLADPAFGFPVGGAPVGAVNPSDWSWHGTLHGLAAPMAGLTVVAAAFVFARRFRREGTRGLAITAWSCVAAYFVLSGIGLGSGDFRIVMVAGTVIWLLPTVVCGHLLTRARR